MHLYSFKELIPEIQTCLKQVEECCKLVLPQELFSDIDFENPKPCCSKDLINQDDYQRDTKLNAITSEIPEVEKAEGEDWMRQHGLGNKGYNLIVEVRPGW